MRLDVGDGIASVEGLLQQQQRCKADASEPGTRQ